MLWLPASARLSWRQYDWCYFDALDLLLFRVGRRTDDDIIDVAWTQIAVNNARELQIDLPVPIFYHVSYYGGSGSTPPLAAVRWYHWRALAIF
jgi:hypothetical protein